MNEKNIFKRLDDLYNNTTAKEISKKDRIVILSDLHLGNGGNMDDFTDNGNFLLHILEHYYSPDRFHLVLNGDIEELQKHSLKKIVYKWKPFYKILERFQKRQALTKLLGNHDYRLKRRKHFLFKTPLSEATVLRWKGDDILIFHGHQAGYFNEFLNLAAAFFIRFFGKPLRIKNYTVAFDSKKKYKFEKRVYDFAKRNKILAIIGHTHRPLFESLSRSESLQFRIEKLCRLYPYSSAEKKKSMEEKIFRYKKELQSLMVKNSNGNSSKLYSMGPVVPCLFNSGCGIGKNGFTAIEIQGGNIELVYWFDKKRTEKYFNFNGYIPRQLGNTDYWRVVLKSEPLDYVFSRVKLLS